ncbi:MAG TPA: hypothetical protein VGU24_08370 [Microvirga sp.]|jgi:hypothetical protein|nr:hypothetical protein [Microvirga sp.]
MSLARTVWLANALSAHYSAIAQELSKTANFGPGTPAALKERTDLIARFTPEFAAAYAGIGALAQSMATGDPAPKPVPVTPKPTVQLIAPKPTPAPVPAASKPSSEDAAAFILEAGRLAAAEQGNAR